MQNVLPTLELVGVIKPVFTEHRKNVVINDGMQPLLAANISAAEIAVADAEALTQRLIKRNLTVQVLHLVNEFIQCLVVQAILLMDEALGIEARFHLKEAEAATERIVNHGETSVCRIHHADDVEVLRDGE